MTAICQKCGRDCVTALALGKHEKKGCEGKLEEVVLTPENHNPEDWKCIEGRVYEPDTPNDLLGDPSKWIFSNRHFTKGTEKCPKCNEIWDDFLIMDENTWVCLQCGCHFMPRMKRDQINEWKLAEAERKRNAQN